jgi:hypothetical protein
MSADRYEGLVRDLCRVIGLPDAETVLQRGAMEVEGFEVLVSHFTNDEQAMYLNFNFGIVTAGRTLRVFQMMLEANLTVYAQDQAQLGLNPDTGGVLLIVRVPMTDDVDGEWLASTFTHYTEHGRYWRDNMSTATEEMFIGICSGEYMWLKA